MPVHMGTPTLLHAHPDIHYLMISYPPHMCHIHPHTYPIVGAPQTTSLVSSSGFGLQ